jgi:hypothetical protein
MIACRAIVQIDHSARDQSFSLRYGVAKDSSGTDIKKVSLKFVLQNPWQLNFVTSELESFLSIHKQCTLDIDLSKCPKDVQDNNEFKTKIRKMFIPLQPDNFVLPQQQNNLFPPQDFAFAPQVPQPQFPTPVQPAPVIQIENYIDMTKVNTQRADRLVPTMRVHIQQYGANPDFKSYATEKNRKKICNYIRSATATPSMTIDEAIYIASRV